MLSRQEPYAHAGARAICCHPYFAPGSHTNAKSSLDQNPESYAHGCNLANTPTQSPNALTNAHGHAYGCPDAYARAEP
eukprot:6095457-Pleurochrysis_carterae.AAC.1